jgi:hypothetical protein
MSRSPSEGTCAPLAELLVLTLTLLLILDRLFLDFKLQGTKGARMVVRADCGLRESGEGVMNNSGGYTGSTGAGELGIPAVISSRAGLGGTGGGPNTGSGLGA